MQVNTPVERIIATRQEGQPDTRLRVSITANLPEAGELLTIDGDVYIAQESYLEPAGEYDRTDKVTVYVEKKSDYDRQLLQLLERMSQTRHASVTAEPAGAAPEPIPADYNGKHFDEAIAPLEGDLSPTPSSPGTWDDLSAPTTEDEALQSAEAKTMDAPEGTEITASPGSAPQAPNAAEKPAGKARKPGKKAGADQEPVQPENSPERPAENERG